MLIATAPADGGGPAAALAWEDTTLLGRLLEQLVDLGISAAHVVTRPEWVAQLEPSSRRHGLVAKLHASADLPSDLRAVEAIARAEEGALVVANADILTQREALAGLLADPRIATGMLTTTVRRVYRYVGFRTRTRRGRVVSAGTPYHYVSQPNGTFLGVLKVAPGDRAALADVAAGWPRWSTARCRTAGRRSSTPSATAGSWRSTGARSGRAPSRTPSRRPTRRSPPPTTAACSRRTSSSTRPRRPSWRGA